MKHAYTYRLRNSLLAVAVCGACAFSGHRAMAQISQGNYVCTDKTALLLMPSMRVSDDTFDVSWSPDSMRLITFNIHRDNPIINLFGEDHTPPESDLEIGRWNKLTHFSDVVWKHRYATQPSLLGQPTWIPHTQYLAQVVFWQEKEAVSDGNGGTRTNLTPNQELLWINTARSTVHPIPMSSGDRLEVSSSRSLAVLINQPFADQNKPALFTPIRIDGSLGTPMLLPLHQFVSNTNWTSDGAKLFVTLNGPRDTGKGSVTTNLLYDPATGESKVIPSGSAAQYRADPAAAPPQHEITLKPSVQHIRDTGVDVVTHPLWAQTVVKSEKTSMLVCSDADLGVISPDGSTIAFRAQSSSWVSDLKSVPLEEFMAMRANALRIVAISNAKQLGLAALLWAEDHDETLPSPNDINTQLTPYLLNDALFDQFTYSYAGGPLSAIESPAETILGTVDGPDGQAVIFSDGHVKWRNR